MRFLEELEAVANTLQKNNVEFMLIGGFAVNFHGYSRATNDLDIWLKPTTENFLSFIVALDSLNFDTDELKAMVFNPKKTFIRIPYGNINIEFLTTIPGDINFTEALKNVESLEIGKTTFKVMGYDDLIKNKKATNRLKDLNDILELEKRRL
jgi:predicted nucleotidyltransferase